MNRELFYKIAGIARDRKMTRLANILYGFGDENIKGTALCELPDLDKLYKELLKTPNMGLGTLRQFDGILKELGFAGHEYFEKECA
tara:strand:- start:250 stop:507 length:258 start_codon:yes stop_codon:yes gene_type:complete